MLGDGHVRRKSENGNPQFTVKMINSTFLNWVGTELGLLSNGVKEYSDPHPTNGTVYILTTVCHPQLEQLLNWYSSGEKRFPESLELSPLITKMWYVCDGDLTEDTRYTGTRSRARISNFDQKNQIDLIRELFEKAGIKFTEAENGFRFSADQTEELLEYMGEPPPGFEYKWNTRKSRGIEPQEKYRVDHTPKELQEQLLKVIRDNPGIHQAKLARFSGYSDRTIRKYCKILAEKGNIRIEFDDNRVKKKKFYLKGESVIG